MKVSKFARVLVYGSVVYNTGFASDRTDFTSISRADEMGEKAVALHTALNSVQALGRGFDVNFDTRLLYCKGGAGSRVVEVDEEHTKDLCLYDNLLVPNVSRDIKNSQETKGREISCVLSFPEV